MSEFSLSPTTSKKIPHFRSLLLSDLSLFCSFILSHPLYFSYLIFFSPYLLKLLSFLSPLFITTFLLLLALLTVSPPTLVHDYSSPEFSESKPSFVLNFYKAVVEKLRAKVEHGDEEFHQYVELEAYKIVFEASSLDIGENSVQVLEVEAKDQCLASSDDHAKVGKSSGQESSDLGVSGGLSHNEDLVESRRPESDQLIPEEKTQGGSLHEKKELEGLWCEKEEREVKPLSGNSNKVQGQRGQAATRRGSKGIGHRKSDTKESGFFGGEEYNSPKSTASQRVEEADLWCSPDSGWDYCNSKGENNSPSLGSFGSMRREKEWRRTLACKLFEERHNVEGGEGMDLLWEAYETDSVKSQRKLSKASKKGKSKSGSTTRSELSYDYSEEEEDEEEVNDGKLCCLQALKFSAGKMNLGMGRPNLVKISKALKGMGWLHHVTKHGKKGHR